MAVRVLEETGLLPHLNPGVMSWEELNRLKPVSPVDGHDARDDVAAAVRDRARPTTARPTRTPTVRLRVLEDAGRLSVPFTTGLLVGIGETLTERAETVFALRKVRRSTGRCRR